MADKQTGSGIRTHAVKKVVKKVNKNQKGRTDIVARADDAFGSTNYAEYVVEKKVEGKYRLQRMLMILFYLAVFAGILGIIALINELTNGLGLFMVPMFCLAPLAAWILHFFTWRYVSIELSYTVDHSYFTIDKVMGGKLAVEQFKCKVKDLEIIAPYDEAAKEKLKDVKFAKEVVALPSMDTYDIYYAIHTAENGDKTLILFQATGQALKALKYYNSEAIVMTEVSR